MKTALLRATGTPDESGQRWAASRVGLSCTLTDAGVYPEIGDPIPGSGGCRKGRWSVAGSGKRGGVRVIYFTRLANGEIWLLVIYKKAVKENIPAHILKPIREVLENE